MVPAEILEHIDRTIKQVWKDNISKDYSSDYMLKEDSLKCCFYYHLRRKLEKILQEYHLRIYTEYYFSDLGYRADLAIVQIDPHSEEEYLERAVIDIIAIIELKFTANSSSATANWVKQDIKKLKNYIQNKNLSCQLYFAIIYEVECSSLAWMDKRSTNNWANGYVTELNAGYINGIMKFEVNTYNNLSSEI